MTEKLFSVLYVGSLLECISFRMSLLVSFQRMALLVAIFQGVFKFLKVFSNTWVLGWLNTIPIEPRDKYARQFAVRDSKTSDRTNIGLVDFHLYLNHSKIVRTLRNDVIRYDLK